MKRLFICMILIFGVFNYRTVYAEQNDVVISDIDASKADLEKYQLDNFTVQQDELIDDKLMFVGYNGFGKKVYINNDVGNITPLGDAVNKVKASYHDYFDITSDGFRFYSYYLEAGAPLNAPVYCADQELTNPIVNNYYNFKYSTEIPSKLSQAMKKGYPYNKTGNDVKDYTYTQIALWIATGKAKGQNIEKAAYKIYGDYGQTIVDTYKNNLVDKKFALVKPGSNKTYIANTQENRSYLYRGLNKPFKINVSNASANQVNVMVSSKTGYVKYDGMKYLPVNTSFYLTSNDLTKDVTIKFSISVDDFDVTGVKYTHSIAEKQGVFATNITPVKGLDVLVDYDSQVGSVYSYKYGESNNPLAAVKFGLYSVVDDHLIVDTVTNDVGYFSFTNLQPSDYYIKEIETLKDYKLDTKRYPITIQANTNSKLLVDNKIINYLSRGSLEFEKLGSSIPLYNTPIMNNNHFIYQTANLNKTKSINKPLRYPDKKTMDEFNLYNKEIIFKLTTNNLVSELKTGLYYPSKEVMDSVMPLSNVEFGLYDNDMKLVSKGLSNQQGLVTITNILPGQYKVQELSTNPGYRLDDTIYEVLILKNQVTRIDGPLMNAAKRGKIKIYKENDAKEPLANIMFVIKRCVEDACENVVDIRTTDEDGLIELDVIEGRYQINEISNDIIYYANDQDYVFEVKDDSVQKVNVVNKRVPLTLQINKVNEDEVKLEGVKFTLRIGQKDITTKTTNDKGVALFNLYLADIIKDGKSQIVTITETKPLPGYLQPTPRTFYLNYDKRLLVSPEPKDWTIQLSSNQVLDVAIDIINYYDNLSLNIYKLDALTNKLISGANFTIFGYQGSKEILIDSVIVQDTPYMTTTRNIYDKICVLETKAPPGYQLDNKLHCLNPIGHTQLSFSIANKKLEELPRSGHKFDNKFKLIVVFITSIPVYLVYRRMA